VEGRLERLRWWVSVQGKQLDASPHRKDHATFWTVGQVIQQRPQRVSAMVNHESPHDKGTDKFLESLASLPLVKNVKAMVRGVGAELGDMKVGGVVEHLQDELKDAVTSAVSVPGMLFGVPVGMLAWVGEQAEALWEVIEDPPGFVGALWDVVSSLFSDGHEGLFEQLGRSTVSVYREEVNALLEVDGFELFFDLGKILGRVLVQLVLLFMGGEVAAAAKAALDGVGVGKALVALGRVIPKGRVRSLAKRFAKVAGAAASIPRPDAADTDAEGERTDGEGRERRGDDGGEEADGRKGRRVRKYQLFPVVRKTTPLYWRRFERTLFRMNIVVNGVHVALELRAVATALGTFTRSVGPGTATVQQEAQDTSETVLARVSVPAEVALSLRAQGTLEGRGNIWQIPGASVSGEVEVRAEGRVELGSEQEARVRVDEDGHAHLEALSSKARGALVLEADVAAHAVAKVLTRQVWGTEWSASRAWVPLEKEVSLSWEATGDDGEAAVAFTDASYELDAGDVVVAAAHQAKRKDLKKPKDKRGPSGAQGGGGKGPSLLDHLREEEHTAHHVDPNLERALDGAPAPSDPKTRLPKTLDHVYVARPSLKPVFYRGTEVGKRLVRDLRGIQHVVHGKTPVKRQFRPDKPGGYYRLLREEVAAGKLDEDVRHPTLIQVVLRTPKPNLPGSVKDAIRRWLRKASLPDRTLPPEIRRAILVEIGRMSLETEISDGEVPAVWVRLSDESRAAIEQLLSEAAAADPSRAKVYAWWQENFDKPERHHVWPKWLLGDAGQATLFLPRCIHNMAGLPGLQEGGFHQRLNALFAKSGDRYLQHVKVEDKRSFEKALKKATDEGKREEVLGRVRKLLLKAYEETVTDKRVRSYVRDRLSEEFDRLSKEGS